MLDYIFCENMGLKGARNLNNMFDRAQPYNNYEEQLIAKIRQKGRGVGNPKHRWATKKYSNCHLNDGDQGTRARLSSYTPFNTSWEKTWQEFTNNDFKEVGTKKPYLILKDK